MWHALLDTPCSHILFLFVILIILTLFSLTVDHAIAVARLVIVLVFILCWQTEGRVHGTETLRAAVIANITLLV